MIFFNDDGSFEVDKTLDASLYGLFAFGVYELDDIKVKNTMEQVRDKLWVKTSVGGLARYEGDDYHRVDKDSPGNPWFITTLWLAQYYIDLAKNKDDLEEGLKILEWVVDHAMPSGILAEQVDPFTGEPLSVSPLTWSHAAFVEMVQRYLNKLIELERCESCGHYKKKKIFRSRERWRRNARLDSFGYFFCRNLNVIKGGKKNIKIAEKTNLYLNKEDIMSKGEKCFAV